MNICIRYYKSSFGELIMGSFDNKLCIADWRYRRMRSAIDNRIQKELNASFVEGNSPIINAAVEALEEYFAGERKSFDSPLLFAGSPFQKKVWNELLNIKYGETVSYLSLAEKVGDVNAIRAVASANGANALAVFVPCHRVIGSNGDLTGYAGGINVKRKLLLLEGCFKKNPQIEMFHD